MPSECVARSLQTKIVMTGYSCVCGSPIYFENTQCLSCQRKVRFLRTRDEVRAITEPSRQAKGQDIRECQNVALGICNWYVADGESLCESCKLTRVVPDLSVADNVAKLGLIESAKRRLIANLSALGLQLRSKAEDPQRGITFEVRQPTPNEPVTTGHSDGVITLNLEEADPVHREAMRCKLGENYRTILGHLRHEVGHYFFDRLIVDGGLEAQFRGLFGDERADYAAALKQHYGEGPRAGWEGQFISAYASSHPWEDWAETWAHYVHARAGTETARHFGITAATVDERQLRAFERGSSKRQAFDAFLAYWASAAVALNELSRSLGVNEAYPFYWAPPVVEKLAFVHQVIRSAHTEVRAA